MREPAGVFGRTASSLGAVITLADLPPLLVTSVAVALGLVFGSFLNVVIHRLPRGESVWAPASRCPGCHAPIRPWNNVPVLGWLLLRGRASCCGARISVRYPLIEAIGGLFGWALVQTVVSSLAPDTPWWRVAAVFGAYLALGLGVVAGAFIDLEHMILPDEITLGGTALGLATVPLRPGATFVDALVGGAAGFLVIWLLFDVGYRALRGRVGMGLGDAKLLMLAGVWFGWMGAAFTLLAGAVQGTLVAVVVLMVRGRIDEPEAVTREREELKRRIRDAPEEERAELEAELVADPLGEPPGEGLGAARIAFGPFLSIAIVEYLLFGEVLVDEYTRWMTL